MATWKSENNVLTLKGQEIFSKVVAGKGRLNISSVKVGSGRVSVAQLVKQTNLTDPKQSLSIKNLKSTEKGSSMICSLDNITVTQGYQLNQIGVFVTHPDYVGEQLYNIAQCNEGTSDTIPAFSDTPLTTEYQMYLNHSQFPEDVQVTVDLTGYALGSQLGDLSDLTTENKDSAIQAINEINAKSGNPSLLLNGCMENLTFNTPIRNTTFVEANNFITDFWKALSDLSLTIEKGAVTLYRESSDVNSGVEYCIPKFFINSYISSLWRNNKNKMCISCRIKNMDNIFPLELRLGESTFIIPPDNKEYLKSSLIDIPDLSLIHEDLSLLSVQFHADAPTGAYFEFLGAKLEVGDKSTPIYLHNYAEELPKLWALKGIYTDELQVRNLPNPKNYGFNILEQGVIRSALNVQQAFESIVRGNYPLENMGDSTYRSNNHKLDIQQIINNQHPLKVWVNLLDVATPDHFAKYEVSRGEVKGWGRGGDYFQFTPIGGVAPYWMNIEVFDKDGNLLQSHKPYVSEEGFVSIAENEIFNFKVPDALKSLGGKLVVEVKQDVDSDLANFNFTINMS